MLCIIGKYHPVKTKKLSLKRTASLRKSKAYLSYQKKTKENITTESTKLLRNIENITTKSTKLLKNIKCHHQVITNHQLKFLIPQIKSKHYHRCL